MGEELADLHELDGLKPLLGEVALGALDVVVVLPGARVARPRGGCEHHGAAHAVARHLRECVLREGLPVAVAEVDRQLPAAVVDLVLEVGDDLPVERVERAHPVEVIVVLAHSLEPLAGDVAPPGDVLQEGKNLVVALRAAEGEDEERVEGL